MSLPDSNTYTVEEVVRLVEARFWWDRTATMWRHHFKRGTAVWVEPVAGGWGPRRWFMGYNGGDYVGTMDESMPFGNLDGLLVWAKLEGLL